MPSQPAVARGVRWYRAGLWMCPPAFRREYGVEMLCDFEDAHREAGGRRPDIWRLRLQMTLDLARTAAVQWARTGLPIIGLVSLAVPLVAAEGLARVARRGAFAIPPDVDHAELLGVILLTTVSVFLIATTIALTLWASRPLRRTRR